MKPRLAALLLVLAVLTPAALAAPAGKTVQGPNYSLFIPPGVAPTDLRPMVMVFAPDGNTDPLVERWLPHAARYKWFVLGFRDYHNTNDITPILESWRRTVKELVAQHPIDPRCLVATGLSGGGMFSHGLAALEPDAVIAIVPNTGMSQPGLQGQTPRGKLACFLASPTDFRYKEMQADEKRLKALGWETKWIEFAGGHTLAPPAAYKQAADWLAGMLNWARSRQKR